MIVLIVLVTLGILSIVNNSACNKISLDPNPVNFEFDASINTGFRVNADDARIRRGEIRVFPNINGGQTVNIEVYTGTTGITPRFTTSSQGSIFELKISQPGFSIFNIPSRCMRSQINVHLPQQLSGFNIPYPNTIEVRNQDIIMMENEIPYRQNITLLTADGDIVLNNFKAQNLYIKTDDGEVSGNITSISNELNISTDDGDVELTLGNAQTPFTPRKITVFTDNGDVKLKFDGNSFSGSYNVRSDDGTIQIDGTKFENQNQAVGTINGGAGGDLNVSTDNGDVDIKFQTV